MADIVITSNGGYPLDQNIYQAVKSMTAAEECVNAGGVIIVCASCSDGHGGEAFYRYFKDNGSADQIWNKILTVPQQQTCADQWQAQILARVMRRARVILVSDMCDHQIIRDMMLTPASSLEEAIKLAKEMKAQGKFVVIPDGVSVIVA
ncbi:Lactate racemase [bioreactor metagenome]|uniref:Lactate racemase n=1 Tax=bioreactor metagenome TaxID=1076179 RepID=A0A645GRP2_9ZZZZ